MKYRDFQKIIKDHSSFDVPYKPEVINYVETFYHPIEPLYKTNHVFKKVLRSFVSLSLLIVVGFVLFLNLTPSSTVTLDINPSVQLILNRYDKVIAIEPLNEDGTILIENIIFQNKAVEIVISSLYLRSIELGFITDLEGYLLIGVSSSDLELELKLEEEIQNYFVTINATLLIMKKHSESSQLYYSGLVLSDELQKQSDAQPEGFNSTTVAAMTTTTNYNDSAAVENADIETNSVAQYSFISQSDFVTYASQLGISETKLQLVLTIFHAYTLYTTYEDIQLLSNMPLNELFILYNQIPI